MLIPAIRTIVLALSQSPDGKGKKPFALTVTPLWLGTEHQRQRLAGVAIALFTLVLPSPAPAQAPQNPVLQIGVVQRFGEDADETLVIEPLSGDTLTLQFKSGDTLETLTTNQVVLETAPRSLPAPTLQERVVLSTHRSFESAEDSAHQWQQRGIETEIAQPDNWQVWGKRAVYSTPLVRRLLLEDLQAAGYDQVFLDSNLAATVPQATFVTNGFRYNRSIVSITTANQRVRVVRREGPADSTRLYGGNLRLQPNAYGTYTLVNRVPIETYCGGWCPMRLGWGHPAPPLRPRRSWPAPMCCGTCAAL